VTVPAGEQQLREGGRERGSTLCLRWSHRELNP
jgi:hypothetical protein